MMFFTWQWQERRRAGCSDRSPWQFRCAEPHCVNESCRRNHLECRSWKRNPSKETTKQKHSRARPYRGKFMVIMIYGWCDRFLLSNDGSFLGNARQSASRQSQSSAQHGQQHYNNLRLYRIHLFFCDGLNLIVIQFLLPLKKPFLFLSLEANWKSELALWSEARRDLTNLTNEFVFI